MKKTLLDKFFEGLRPHPPMFGFMEHVPLFRYPINYNYTMPQLNLVNIFNGQYLLE